jgi:hypothetical protein
MKRAKSLFPVIPAKVPRQARDPELVEWAGIQCLRSIANFLDPGFHRGDDSWERINLGLS